MADTSSSKMYRYSKTSLAQHDAFQQKSNVDGKFSGVFTFSTFLEYARSEILDKRLLATNKCVDVLQNIFLNHSNESEFDEYFGVLEKFFTDDIVIQSSILDQMKNVFKELQNNEIYNKRANVIFPTYIIQSLSSTLKVQTNAIDAITNLIEENYLLQDVVMQVIVPSLFDYVLNLNWNNVNEVVFEKWFFCRVDVVAILNKIAKSVFCYPKQWVYEEFLPSFSALFTDSNAVVRKFSIELLGIFANFFGEGLTDKCFVPHLVRAVHDVNYRVRKLCCVVFVDVALNSSMEVRAQILTPKFLCLLGDSNKAVYEAAICQIGPFIATFADPNKTGFKLINGRLSQIHSDHSVKKINNEQPEEYDSNLFNKFEPQFFIDDEKQLKKFSSIDDLTLLLNDEINERLIFEDKNDVKSNFLKVRSDDENSDKVKNLTGYDDDNLYQNPPNGFLMPDNSFFSNPSSFQHFQNAFTKKLAKNEVYGNDFMDTSNLFDDFEFEERKNEYLKNSILHLDDNDDNNLVLPFSTLSNVVDQNYESDLKKNNNSNDLKNDIKDDFKKNEIADSFKDKANSFNSCVDNSNPTSTSIFYWSFNNISLNNELDAYFLRNKKIKNENLKNNEFLTTTSESVEINQVTSEIVGENDIYLNGYDSNKLYVQNELDQSLDAKMKVPDFNICQKPNSISFVEKIPTNIEQTLAADLLESQNGTVAKDEVEQSKMFLTFNGRNSKETALISTSSFWQKRLDLLHRSVQSVVHNGSNALAVTAARLPSSLKRLSLDSIHNNSLSGPSSIELSLLSPKSFIDRTSLHGQTSSHHNKTVPNRFLSTVPENLISDNTKSKKLSIASSKLKTPQFASRFTVSTLQENTIDSKKTENFEGNKKNKNVTVVEPTLDLSLKLCDETSVQSPKKEIDNEGAFINILLNNQQNLYFEIDNPTYSYGNKTFDNEEKNTNDAKNYFEDEINQNTNNEKNRFQEEFIRYSIERSRRFLTEEEQEFLSNSKQDVIPQPLLDRLIFEIHMTDPERFNVNRHVAHSISAIVYTFGGSKWIFIKGLYLLLTDHYQVEVRECMAHSLHEVAAIIGTSNADRDLLPVFQKFLGDSGEVQYGLLKNLYDFCKILSLPCREQLAQRLSLFVTVDEAYRLRAEFAQQLVLLVRLFTPLQVNRYLSAFALTFSTDRIAEVRNNGVNILAEVLAQFIREEWMKFFSEKINLTKKKIDGSNSLIENDICSDQPIALPLTDSLLNEIRAGFWRTRNWRRRQSFGRMLDTILQKELITEEQFFYIFYDDFIHVSEDEVANVRQYFCSMCQLARENNFFKTDRSVLISVKSRLREMAEEDSDLEIRHQAQIALGDLDPETAELDLGQREAILQEASESIYQRIRQSRQSITSSSTTEVSTAPSSLTSCYSLSSPKIETPSILSIDFRLGNGNTNNSVSTFYHYQYYVNNENHKTFKKPPLAVAEDEDDNSYYQPTNSSADLNECNLLKNEFSISDVAADKTINETAVVAYNNQSIINDTNNVSQEIKVLSKATSINDFSEVSTTQPYFDEEIQVDSNEVDDAS